MRKFLFISIFLSLLFIANNSFAAITPGAIPTADQLGISDAPKIENIDAIKSIIEKIVYWIYIIFFIVAVGFILFAAYSYLTAQGDPEGVNKARTQIMYAVIAIVVAFLALGADLIVRSLITTGGAGGSGNGECSADRAEESRTGKPLCPQYWPQQGYNVRVK